METNEFPFLRGFHQVVVPQPVSKLVQYSNCILVGLMVGHTFFGLVALIVVMQP